MVTNLILILKAIILGIVEGFTEFLPISSTGHMIIIGHFLKFEGDFAKLFEIFIQLGSILAVVVLFRKKIFASLKSLKPKGFGFKLWTNLIIGFIPAGIIGLLFHKKIEEYLMVPIPVAGALLIGGIWMIFAEKKYRDTNKIKTLEEVGYKQAFIIGCFQCLSVIWPGFSRSASTIIGGWIMGLTSVVAAEFSFFLAIPTMVIATGFELIKTKMVLNSPEIISLIVGFIVSFLVALVVVGKFINYLKKKPMKGFAVYRIIVGIIIIIFSLVKLI
jgi:undecaprenyl-diphosphatase